MSTALITGGAEGLGAEAALFFASRKFNVAIHYHKTKPDNIIEKISKFNVKCLAYQFDLCSGLSNLIKDVCVDFDDLSILVNNASFFNLSRGINFEESDYNNSFNIHVKNPLFLTMDFIKLSVKNKLVINIADQIGQKPESQLFIHGLSKNSMIYMTQALAGQGIEDIRFNAICPGFIDFKKSGATIDFVNTLAYFLDNKSVNGEIISINAGKPNE